MALTLGEPAGIGPDLALAIWRRRAELGIPPFYIVADPDFLAGAPTSSARRSDRHRDAGRGSRDISLGAAGRPLDVTVSAEPGQPDRSSAPAAVASIRRAVADVMAGAAAAVVTNPVAKNVLYNWGFAEPGHTEFLAKLVQEATGKSLRPVMMLWSPELAVVPVTIHLPLREIFSSSRATLVVETGRIVAHDLPRGSASPIRGSRLPGSIRMPAKRARSAKKTAPSSRRPWRSSSPRASTREARCPPTRCSTSRRARTYDAALCMYHDQALIPIKTLAFDHAVNVTLGLPFVRTSPDHGTAFDIAGTGSADPASLVAALRLAARLAAGDQAPVPLAAS